MTTRPRLVALAVTALVLLLALVFVTPARSVPEPTPAPVTSWTPVAAPRSAPVSSGAVGASATIPARSGAPSSPGAPTPTPAPVADHAGTPVVVPADDPQGPKTTVPPGRAGWLAWANVSHGAAYLAIPEGPGHRVRLCGAGGCLEAVSNDAGPDAGMRAARRVGDLGLRLWTFVCGLPDGSRGLCWVTVTTW